MYNYPAMWFTSRTPAIEGQTHCAMARYLGYHAGSHGTGWRRKQTAVPLATGAAVHEGLAALGSALMQKHAVDPEIIACATTKAAKVYVSTATDYGLQLTAGELHADMKQVIAEQATLIEGLIWIWALERLPGLLHDYRVIGVEEEETLVLDCTCGVGEAVSNWQTHATRGCLGIVQMGRADWLVEQQTTGEIAYIEFKTKSTPNIGWERAWEHSGQLLVNMEAASRRLGKSVSHAFIDVLYKGRRWSSKEGVPKTQQSSVCYGIYEPGGLGSAGQWRQRKDREHWSSTVPIWDESYPMTSVRKGASRVESWITGKQWPGIIQVLGPFPRPDTLVPRALDAIRAEERRWRIDVEDIRHGMPADQIVARSWQCTGFDGAPCAYVPLCFGMETEGVYEPRVPHHLTERQAVEAGGVIFLVNADHDDD